jgi:hypothetical protein
MQKRVGRRTIPLPALRPSAALLKAACAVNEPLKALLPGGRIAAPKGIFRFRTMAEANRQQEIWLADAMASMRRRRA